MAILYGFFDSIEGDRLYSAEDLTGYFLRLIPSGVLAGGFEVAASGLTVSVSKGRGFLRTRWVNVTEPETLEVAACTSGVRQDRVVLRLNTLDAARNISLTIKQGTPPPDYAPPTLTRNGSVFEISLARLIVGTESVLAVIDERGDESVCGYVQGFGAFGGMSFKRLTRAEYDALEIYSNTVLYVVTELNGDITAYIGASRLGGGNTEGAVYNAVLNSQGLNGEIGTATREDI